MRGRLLPTPALVMNMFYTGLGIARSLGEHGIPVFGLSSIRRVYGNFTRYAKVLLSPDSRTDPEALLQFLLAFAGDRQEKCIIFPTRDDDVVFLDRFRQELEEHFVLAIPNASAVETSLNKWQTYRAALQAGVPMPKCWNLEGQESLREVLQEVTFPCVLKPIAAHHWRKRQNWEVVGQRKAILINTPEELIDEYTSIAQADSRALLQEMIPGGDDCLRIAAVYCDRNSEILAGFNTQKLLQLPATFGTGCIVQSSNCPELFSLTSRLLASIGFTGIAEVEFKWNAVVNEFQLIEINPRPWDQHRLGAACGVDLINVAYCDYAGIPHPTRQKQFAPYKWIAEDALFQNALRLLWRRDSQIRSLLRLARGKRTYAIWSAADPLPFVVYIATDLLPHSLGALFRRLWFAMLHGRNSLSQTVTSPNQGKDHA